MQYTYDDIEYLGESTYGNPEDHWISLALPEHHGHDLQFMFYTNPRNVTGKDMEREGFNTVFNMKKSCITPMRYSQENRDIEFYVQQVIISVRNDYLEDDKSQSILHDESRIMDDMISIMSVLRSQRAYQQQSFWTQEGIYDLGIIDPVAIMSSPLHGIALTDILQDDRNVTEEEALRMGIMSIAEGEVPWWTYSDHTVYDITDNMLDYTQSGKLYRKAYISIDMKQGVSNGRYPRENRSIT